MSAANSMTASSIEDLREYVDAFRTSSNRSRYALYVVVIASALIGIATRNVHPGGWSLRRLEKWYTTPLTDGSLPYPDTVFFKILREEYAKQFAARSVLQSSPIPGVSIDVNEIGLVGGIALTLLMLVLVFCIFREYENLQLALYKVRQLCAEEGNEHSRGDSRANLLYHALAMSQVLSSPPTLARWHKRGILRHFGFIFFVPFAVQLMVVIINWKTRHVAEWYKVDPDESLAWQIGIASILLALSLTAWIASRAMALRWSRAFFRVNPARNVAPQMTLLQWMKIPNPLAKEPRDPALVVQIVDSLRFHDPRRAGKVSVEHRLHINGARIQRSRLLKMSATLRQKGEEAAREWCSRYGRGTFGELREFRTIRSEYVPTSSTPPRAEWTVNGVWSFYYVPGRHP